LTWSMDETADWEVGDTTVPSGSPSTMGPCPSREGEQRPSSVFPDERVTSIVGPDRPRRDGAPGEHRVDCP
jgi:hypothetical protein